MKDKETENIQKIILDPLNSRQREAVLATEGPVLIIAGAGTGKTTVVTERIKWLISQNLARPAEILALTFTDSGVKAMRERLLSIIGSEAYYVNIYTFHSFCSDILRSNPDRFVLSEDLEPLSDLERRRPTPGRLFRRRSTIPEVVKGLTDHSLH